MPLNVPATANIAALSASEVWAYLPNRRLTSLATPDDIIKFLGKGTGTEVPSNKSLYDLVALDRLDHASYGLPALSIYGLLALDRLDNPTYGLTALNTDLDLLLTRLTALRAGYLDNLSAGAVAQASVATEARLAELDVATLDSVAERIGRLAGMSLQGTKSHPSGTSEQTVVEVALTKRRKVWSILLDLVNLTKSATVRVYTKVVGASWTPLDSLDWNTSMNDGVLFNAVVLDQDFKVTLQSVEAEGASRDITYKVNMEEMN